MNTPQVPAGADTGSPRIEGIDVPKVSAWIAAHTDITAAAFKRSPAAVEHDLHRDRRRRPAPCCAAATGRCCPARTTWPASIA
jgi:hypothetical protein